MKLPEYDNRPGPGVPLYTDKSGSAWDDIKFPAMALILVVSLILFIVGITLGPLYLLRGLFGFLFN